LVIVIEVATVALSEEGEDSMVGSCKCGNEPSGAVKGGKFIDQQ
jgi:hypothetical protein